MCRVLVLEFFMENVNVEEFKDEEVRREVEKVRKRVEVLERKLSNSARAFCWRLL